MIDPSGSRGIINSSTGGTPGTLATVTADADYGMVAATRATAYAMTTTGLVPVGYTGTVGALVSAITDTLYFVRADRQQRATVAALYGSGSTWKVALFNGSDWTTLTAQGNFGPIGDYAPWIEVLA